jgi:hypothetical protein
MGFRWPARMRRLSFTATQGYSCDARKLHVLDVFDDVWLILFTLELMLKLVAMGFLPFAKSNWNILDFVVRPFHSTAHHYRLR